MIDISTKISKFKDSDFPIMFIEKEEAVKVSQDGKMIMIIGDE